MQALEIKYSTSEQLTPLTISNPMAENREHERGEGDVRGFGSAISARSFVIS